jgi:hypothetical protein
VVRSWIRQALRASGVAILVPAAIAAAVALSVVGGGGSVGSLGQVIAGPAVPPAEAATRVATPRRDEHVRRRGKRGQSPQSAPAQPGPEPVATIPERRRAQRVPTRVPVTQPAPAPSSPPSAPPSAPPAPQPHPIHDTGTQVAETVRPLPVAGPVAADAVEAVVDLVDPSA